MPLYVIRREESMCLQLSNNEGTTTEGKDLWMNEWQLAGKEGKLKISQKETEFNELKDLDWRFNGNLKNTLHANKEKKPKRYLEHC